MNKKKQLNKPREIWKIEQSICSERSKKQTEKEKKKLLFNPFS